jgi:hypothetical protein
MSQISKLNEVNSKLGATRSGQQTTRNIYDTVSLPAGQTQMEFFTELGNKNEFQTNLTTNKLDSSESMVVKSIFMTSSRDLVGAPGFMKNHFLLNLYVGNQCVLKDFNATFNCTARGVAFDRIHNTNELDNNWEARLLTDIIIPPQTAVKATFRLATNASTQVEQVRLSLKGYGIIFSAGNSF